MRVAGVLALVFATFAVGGCGSFAEKTKHLDAYDEAKGYRYERLDQSANTDDLFVILTFSGGGTRAAAFSYGVLEALRCQQKGSATLGLALPQERLAFFKARKGKNRLHVRHST